MAKRLAAPFGDYAATQDGHIITFKHGKEGERLKESIDDDGYPRVNLAHADEKHGFKRERVHNLIAAAYHGPRPEGAEVLHLDGNRTNNKPSNLKYGSRSENATQREADARADAYIRLDSAFEIGKWELTPEGYLRATAVVAQEGYLDYPEEGHREYVSEDALRSGAESLLHKPVVFEHPQGGTVDSKNWRDLAVGMVAESRYDSDLRAIVAGIVITDETAIRKVLTDDIREVSPGYRAALAQDTKVGPMQVRRFSNHLAITQAGRGGREASIRLDSTLTSEQPDMDKEELERKLDTLQKKLDALSEERDALKAKNDAFEQMAKDRQDAEDEEKLDSRFVERFNERVQTLDVARQLDVQHSDTQSTVDIQRAVVTKRFPTMRLDSTATVSAVFEAVVADLKANTATKIGESFAANRLDSTSVAKTSDYLAIYDSPTFDGAFQFSE